MLVLKGINKTFNKDTANEKVAINNVDFTLEDGEFVTVIGGNGAGKSTLLNIIAGSLDADKGLIMLDDMDITNINEHKKAKFLGRVFQDPSLGTASDMNIEEHLALANRRGKHHGLKWGISKAERVDFIKLLAELNLGLEKRLEQKVGLLSGGQRQAITLLMATMNQPKLLLLDEHTAALDPKTAEKVLTLTERLVNEHHLSTLMVTHNMRDALRFGNRLIMMSEGRIIVDIKGEEKKNLKVEDLLELFSKASKDDYLSDKNILG